MTTVFNLNRYDKIVANDLSLNGTISTALGGLSQWEDSSSDIYFSGGNVGIGTTSPSALLDINGSMRAAYNSNTASYFGRVAIGYVGHSDWAGFAHLDHNNTSSYALMQAYTGQTRLNSANGEPLYFLINNSVKMTLASNGNIGIGTASPAQKLHSTGRVQAGEMVLGDLPRAGGSWAGLYHTRIHDDTYGVGYNTNAYALSTGENGNLNLNCTTTTNGTAAIYFQANASTKMFMNNNGNVGIGTTSPYAKLHVNGTHSAGNINMNSNRKWIIHYQTNSNVQGPAASNGAMSASIYASGDIVTSNHLISSSIYATSDRRIKQNIVDINDNSALETLRLLKPKKYEYIDKFSKTQSTVWGFIAQEVAETLPYATHTGKNEIPNIYQVANVSNDNLLTFNTNIQLEYDASGSLVNDLLLYDASDNRIDVTIQEIVSTTELRIESETVLSNEVFVYGQRVNDFHYLDKPAIFTVGISAVQELDKQQQADKAKIATLETQVSLLESENAALKTQMADVLQRLSNANL